MELNKIGIDVGKKTWLYFSANKSFHRFCNFGVKDNYHTLSKSTDILLTKLTQYIDGKKINTADVYMEETILYSPRVKVALFIEFLIILFFLQRKYRIFLVHPRHIRQLKKNYPRKNFTFKIPNEHSYTAVVATYATKYTII